MFTVTTHDFTQFTSPFTWRYGTEPMRQIWSEHHKHQLWRSIWIALATAQNQAGLVSNEELADLKKHGDDIAIDRIHEIEKDVKHDVVSSIKEFAEKAKVGGGKIHLGATSMDVVDNADAIRTQQSLVIIEQKLLKTLQALTQKIENFADTTCMGYTHFQPAEPTTVGYRFALYAQDLLVDHKLLQFVKKTIAAKGMKGAVGTRASYQAILADTDMSAEELDEAVMTELNLKSVLIANQVAPRKFDFLVLTTLASITASLAKFSLDVRLLSSPAVGEWHEAFGKKQVGSSAMPFKKNPINSEKISSLARYVKQLPNVALENESLSFLERSLDDSSNKRVVMAEAMLATDEVLRVAEKLITNLEINTEKINQNLQKYAPFAATENIIIEAVKKGADRQVMHEVIRQLAMQAWEEIGTNSENPLPNLLSSDRTITKYLSSQEVETLLDVSHHVGDAPKRAKKLSKLIKKSTSNQSERQA